ncbi:hypothetical protein MHI12_19895 [Paenibacillus sp. FSL H8-0280]|uniref:hypothetical protein n=1 Tax=Paenibacillus sp. FSL H8-0280 TaxID=2921382 RepID=UPI003251E0FA
MYGTIEFWRLNAIKHFHLIDFDSKEEMVEFLKDKGYEVAGEPKKKEFTVLTVDKDGPVNLKIKIH